MIYKGYTKKQLEKLNWEDFFKIWSVFLQEAKICWKRSNLSIDKQIFEQMQIKRRKQKAQISTRKVNSRNQKSKMKKKFSRKGKES
eukprot:Pgem_evm1s16001